MMKYGKREIGPSYTIHKKESELNDSDVKNNMDRIKFLKKVWGVAKQYKWSFLLSYAILVIELVFNQVMPLLLRNVVDAALYKSDLMLFLKASGFYIIIFIGQQSCDFFQLQYWQILNNKYVYHLRMKCYEKVLSLKAKHLTNINTGDIIQTINGDTMEFHHIIQRYAMRVVNAGIGVILSLIIVAFMKWEISVIIAVFIPTSVLLTNKIKKKMNEVANEIRDKQGLYNSWLLEIIKGLREIKLFAAENNVVDNFTDKNNHLIKTNKIQAKTQFTSDQIISLIYFISQLIFYIVSALFVVKGSINVAEFIAISAYYSSITYNIQWILYGNMQYQTRKVAVERVFKLLDSEFEDETNLKPLTVTNGEIKFCNLSFAYNPNTDVLNNITYKINSGKRIGIVGESGVGKSTLVHIMIKFFVPDSGTVMIDGQDLAECTYSSVRENIGIVSQETIIFDATVKDNICFGKNVPDETIWNILDQAYLKSEIERLPNGIHTILGKGGQNLSGGQN